MHWQLSEAVFIILVLILRPSPIAQWAKLIKQLLHRISRLAKGFSQYVSHTHVSVADVR